MTQARAGLDRASDRELCGWSAQGSRPAFGELVRRHGAAVRGLLRRMGAQAALADDLAQDAFLIAFTKMAGFRGEGAFVGWIKQIAARLYIRRWRREARFDVLAEPPEPALDDAPDRTDERPDLDAALGALSRAERLCVTLCLGAGFSHSEAAEVLQAPAGTVKSHVKRGLDKLRKRMAPPEPDDTARSRIHG